MTASRTKCLARSRERDQTGGRFAALVSSSTFWPSACSLHHGIQAVLGSIESGRFSTLACFRAVVDKKRPFCRSCTRIERLASTGWRVGDDVEEKYRANDVQM